ncbi:MAG: replication restart helicase PriA [Pirellulaceae bacterium]
MSRQQALFDTAPAPWSLDDQADWQAARIVFSQQPFGPYDYLVPHDLRGRLKPGHRVRVPLGRGNRSIEGYCVQLILPGDPTATPINPDRLKPITQLVDEQPLIAQSLLELGKWISYRWHCPLGVTIETIVPVAVREKSNTREAIFLECDPDVIARLDEIKLPAKQRVALETLRDSRDSLTPAELARASGCTSGPITALRKKKLVRQATVRIEQRSHALQPAERRENFVLNDDQQAALNVIHDALKRSEHESILLHGITGSGKTEVYIQAIQQVIEFGRQAIVLVPEISLTPQTKRRFNERFDHVAVLHSNLTAAQRAWHWRQIAAGKVQVVIGARSAIFAPVPHLGLIVLDEEHDSSFKQDAAPRYHARDVARWRSEHEKVPLILGSATPSLESWWHGHQENARIVSLPKRILDRPLPNVTTIDLRGEFANRKSRGAISRQLHGAMLDSLQSGGQVILLLNRRGYATSIQCPQCGHVEYCPDCAIAMTHHRDRRFIMCHYCNHHAPEPTECSECGFSGIRFWGVGTQRLEQEVRARFPDYSCIRMDTDSMQRPGSHEAALDLFRAGERRILLGTQMIAKGLDFPDVTLVGVVNADTALHLLDFRAGERTFNLITQVAGRTGRGPRGGRVMVQTFDPEHPAIVAASHHDYVTFAETEMEHRREFAYPPFGCLARFVIRGPQEIPVRQMAETLADAAENWPGLQPQCRVMGPAEAPIVKLRGKFRFHFLLQCADEELLHDWIEAIQAAAPDIDDVQHIVDVDPQEML